MEVAVEVRFQVALPVQGEMVVEALVVKELQPPETPEHITGPGAEGLDMKAHPVEPPLQDIKAAL